MTHQPNPNPWSTQHANVTPTAISLCQSETSSTTLETNQSTASKQMQMKSKKSSQIYHKDKERRLQQYKLKQKVTRVIEQLLDDLELLIDIKNDLKQFH